MHDLPPPSQVFDNTMYITALVEDFQLEAARFKGVPVPRPEQMKLRLEVCHWDLSVPPPSMPVQYGTPTIKLTLTFWKKFKREALASPPEIIVCNLATLN